MKRLLLLSLLCGVLLGTWACTFPRREGVETLKPPVLQSPAVTSLATAFPTGDLEQQIFVEVTVYFTDSKRYASSVPPFEVGVMRQVPSWTPLPEAVLVEFFSERTEEEQALGLERVHGLKWAGDRGSHRPRLPDRILQFRRRDVHGRPTDHHQPVAVRGDPGHSDL